MSIPRNWRGIEHVTIEQITAYLVERGWTQVEYHNKRLMVFALTDDDRVFALPASPTVSDFYPRMMEAIERIAQEEDKATYVVLQRFVNGEPIELKPILCEVKRQLLLAHQSDTPGEELEATILYIDNLLKKDWF